MNKLASLTIAALLLVPLPALHAAEVANLRCEHLKDPLGIDVTKPRLSWIMQDGVPKVRGQKQTAYQILVASIPELLGKDQGDIWDSGKVASEDSLQVPYHGKPLATAQTCYWKVRFWDQKGRAGPWSDVSSWTMGVISSGDWKAKWIGAPEAAVTATPKATSTVVVRREFTVKPGLRRALVNVCGLGEYEMTLNAAKVGDDLFPSGWTQYNKTCLYDTHDITAILRTGANDLALLLGNGRYNVTGGAGRYCQARGSFGHPKAIAQVRLEYTDGTTEIIGTDESWQVSEGPVTFSCVYGGEDYDARWRPQWEPAKIVTGPGGELKGLSCAAPPIRKFDVLKSVKLTNNVFDLGQNASLMPRLSVKGPAGASVKITPSELIKPSGELNDDMCHEQAYWRYTLAGTGTETYFPKFFYRGARYLKVECTGGAELVAIEGVVVHSSAETVGEFSCSSELFNRIRTLVRWAQRSNMMSVLTDCPHREKLGWLEEYHLNGPSLRYGFDLATLYTKAMNDMADAQLENGLVPNIAPEYMKCTGVFRDSAEWGSSSVLVPWQQYEFVGDISLLRRYYDVMQRYVAYLGSQAKDHIIEQALGDWYDIGPNGPGYPQNTPKALTATAIYYEDVTVMTQVAKLLGRDDDARRYEELAGKIRLGFHAKFPELPASQTGRAMPLVVGLVEPAQRQAVLDALVSDLQQKGLTSGEVGYTYLLRALAKGGRSDVIFAMNNQSDKPGYGYQLRLGKTSLTEAWNGGSSQNHFMLGQIMEWFYHGLAGIQPDPTAPGFKKIVIRPAIVGDLTWVKCHHDSPYGRIVSNWKREGAKLTMDVTIPPNTTSTVYVPAKDGAGVTESGNPVDQAAGVKLLRMENNAAVYAVGSGTYRFQSTLRETIK